jgi:hypothetical protein
MISLDTALELKGAGLVWVPQILDFFAIPDRNMDDRVFVISDMLVTVDILQGMQVVSFQGSSEWALDYLVTTDAVWIPSEMQLRQALEAALLSSGRPDLKMTSSLHGYHCDFEFHGKSLSFEAEDVSELYAGALLYVLRDRSASTGNIA